MGVVYLARDPDSGRQVALKRLPPEMASDAEYHERFRREARQLAKLSHPNIVAFVDTEDDFISMEYVDGGSLRQLLGKLAWLEWVGIFAQILDGLDYIHRAGIIHRDLTPDNILMTQEKVPKISDFGLSRRLEQKTRLTEAGMVLGTCGYLAPEQILTTEVGPAGDLYSLGVVMFEALTGRLPFQEETDLKMMHAHIRTPPPRPSSLLADLPGGLDALLLRMLEKEPGFRPETAGKARDDLLAVLKKHGRVQTGFLGTLKRWLKR